MRKLTPGPKEPKTKRDRICDEWADVLLDEISMPFPVYDEESAAYFAHLALLWAGRVREQV